MEACQSQVKRASLLRSAAIVCHVGSNPTASAKSSQYPVDFLPMLTHTPKNEETGMVEKLCTAAFVETPPPPCFTQTIQKIRLQF